MASTGGVAPGSRAATPHLSYGYMKRSTREASTEEGELIQCMTERLKKRVEEGGEVAWCGVDLWNSSSSLDGDGSPPCQVRRDAGCEVEGRPEAYDKEKNVTEELKHVEQEAVVQGKPTVRTAWLSAAMAWRQKNMPSASELKQRREEVSRRISEAARMRNNAREQHRYSTNMEIPNRNIEPKQPVMPEEDAADSEWKAYFRMHHTLRIADASSFVQVLRAFNVPCSDPKKIKTAYMQAVRMYHPDSNSKSRKWSSARGKAEAEEIMKLINSRKPEGFQ